MSVLTLVPEVNRRHCVTCRVIKSLSRIKSLCVAKRVSRVAATRVLRKALKYRKECARSLLRTIRLINSIEIRDRDDFGEGIHTPTQSLSIITQPTW